MTIVDPIIFNAFLNESKEAVESLEADLVKLESDLENKNLINSVFRSLHTIKGNASFLDLDNITTVAHEAETLLDEVRSGKRKINQTSIDLVYSVVDVLQEMLEDPEMAQAIKSVNVLKVEESKIEHIVSLVHELELLRYSMEKLPAQLEGERGDISEGLFNLELATSKASRITSELGAIVFGARLVPVNNVFRRFPRIVRELAKKLDKKIELKVLNGSAKLDKSIVEAIADPMTHLIRNAVDHGVESPENRQAKGKKQQGTITLNSFVDGNLVVIEIKDDGKGMDPDLILYQAAEKGIIFRGKENTMSDSEKLGLIFAPGFSTAEQVTDISGRGVGMDVVKSNINKLKGMVQIESTLGIGTTIQLRFPFSVVVASCLYVYIDEVCYAIPLSQMEESIHIAKGELFTQSPQRLKSGEEAMAVYSLQELLTGKFQIKQGIKELPAVRVRRKDGRLIALIVDEFSIMEEAVIHSVDSYISSIPGIQGGVIRRDGLVSIALSIDSLLETTFKKIPLAYAVNKERKHPEITDLQKLIEDAREITDGVLDFKLS